MPQSAKTLAPVISEEQRVDVCLEGSETVIRLSNWVEGLGWTCQKTLRLESGMLEDLHRALAAARRKTQVDQETSGSGKVIGFPVVA